MGRLTDVTGGESSACFGSFCLHGVSKWVAATCDTSAPYSIAADTLVASRTQEARASCSRLPTVLRNIVALEMTGSACLQLSAALYS